MDKTRKKELCERMGVTENHYDAACIVFWCLLLAGVIYLAAFIADALS